MIAFLMFLQMKRDDLRAGTEAAVARSIENVKQAKLSAGDFVLTELRLGLEFLELASRYRSKGNTADADRNLEAAKKAYNAIVKFLPKAVLTQPQRQEVDQGLRRLKASLKIQSTV